MHICVFMCVCMSMCVYMYVHACGGYLLYSVSFNYLCMCICAWVYAYAYVKGGNLERQKRVLDPLKLEFQAVVSLHMDSVSLPVSTPSTGIISTSPLVWLFKLVLGIGLRFLCISNWAISPAPEYLFFLFSILSEKEDKCPRVWISKIQLTQLFLPPPPWPLHKTCQSFSILLTSSHWKTTSEL